MLTLFLQPFKRCFDFQGRARRSEFWLIFLILGILYSALLYFVLYPLLEVAVGLFTSEQFIKQVQESLTVQNCQKVITSAKEMLAILNKEQAAIDELPKNVILSMLASLAFAAHFGVLSLFFYTFLLSLTIRRLHDSNRSAWYVLVMLLPIIGTIWFVILIFLPGTKGKNNYGADPR